MPRKVNDALIWVEQAAPGTPAAGTVVQYAKADGLLYSKDDAGVETVVTGGGGGGASIAYQASAPGSPTTGMLWVDSDDPSSTYDDMQVFGVDGVLTTQTGAGRLRFPFAVTLLGVTAAVGTAPTGAALNLDVNKNGTTIYGTNPSNKPSIAISANATASEPVPDTTAMAAGDYLTVDVDQIGSTISGSDLTVFVRYRRT